MVSVILEVHAIQYVQASSNGKRTVSFRLCFNACFGQSVDVAGREAVDQGGILARVAGHRGEVERTEKVCVGWLVSGEVFAALLPWMMFEGMWRIVGFAVAEVAGVKKKKNKITTCLIDIK